MKNCDINIRDPFVLVYEGKYYMYGTRAKDFGIKTNGFDVYVGDDLENWSEPKEVFNSSKWEMNTAVNWAPEVHLFNGSFYMFATFTKPNGLRGTYILKSDMPDGEFKPHSDGAITPLEWECLDGTLYIENGKPYSIAYAKTFNEAKALKERFENSGALVDVGLKRAFKEKKIEIEGIKIKTICPNVTKFIGHQLVLQSVLRLYVREQHNASCSASS